MFKNMQKGEASTPGDFELSSSFKTEVKIWVRVKAAGLARTRANPRDPDAITILLSDP
jgi:hypothetical protein